MENSDFSAMGFFEGSDGEKAFEKWIFCGVPSKIEAAHSQSFGI
ncbi:hypothetical protein [Leptospira ainazelensis]|nr:hypothetical protein [Leptospira ainazelensis]